MDRRKDLIHNLSLHQLSFSDGILSSGSSTANNGRQIAKDIPNIKFYPTETSLFVTQGQILVAKSLLPSSNDFLEEVEDKVLYNQELVLLKNHSSSITCVGIAEKYWLICACTDDEVTLFKQDGLLKTFSSVKIAEDLGRILSCAVIVRNELILTCVAKPTELVLIQGTSSDNPLTELGALDLTQLEIIGNCDRINVPFTWLQLAYFRNVLHAIGVATGNVVSLMMWEVSTEGGFRLKDHRMASQIKAIAGVDFAKMDESEEYTLVMVSPEGHTELFLISIQGLCLLSQIKLEDFVPAVELCPNSGDLQFDFRIFSARLFYGKLENEEIKFEAQEDGTGSEIEELNNTFTEFRARQVECPKIQICIATNTGIAIVNLRSGETEFVQKFPDIFQGDSMMLSNAKMITTKNSQRITVALQPLLSKAIYTFQMEVEIPGEVPHEDFTLLTTKEVEPKSILRKKLKSPPPPPVKKRSPHFRMSQPVTRRSISGGGLPRSRQPHPVTSNTRRLSLMPPPSPALSKDPTAPDTRRLSLMPPPSPALCKDPTPQNARRLSLMPPPSSGLFKGYKKRPSPIPSAAAVKAKPGSAPTSPLPSARSIRIKPKSTYNGYDQLNFSDNGGNGGGCLPTRLHDPLSHMRMIFTADGHAMAVAGNTPPMIVFKTTAVFEPLCVYKDSRRITALDFSFCNNHHLMIATNDGKTEIVNWKLEKQLLALQFNSKFNEHVHAQFYYLDKFILQPEDNRIVFYSFRIGIPTSITLKAGTLLMTSQQITALAAPNRFYSSRILCGGSNKCLTVFDADTEQEVLTIPNAHSRPISCIRINEAPKGPGATFLSDLFLTSANSYTDPIKIWDLRIAKCVTRIGDVSNKIFVPTSRPSISPCGRYIASGLEENGVQIYDIRKINSRVAFLKTGSPVLDVSFDPNFTMLWLGCRNGNLWNFNTF